MITFGLTGGIASGKSTVTRTIQSLGIPMVDADLVARQLVEPGTAVLKELSYMFGEEYLNDDGTLNRTKVGALVFSNRLMRRQLDTLMLPLINDESSKQIKELHDKGHKIVGYDGALILEMGNAHKYSPLILVHCPQELQVSRLMSRNGLTSAEAMSRINAQMSVEDKLKMSDYNIDSSGTIEASKYQAKVIVHQIRKQFGRFCFDCGKEYSEYDAVIVCESCGGKYV